MGKIKSAKSGFTFIEILVTVGVVGFVLPVIFAIVFTIFRQQTKIYRLNEIKKQGDYILNLSKVLITSSTGIYSEAALTNLKCDGTAGNQSYSSVSGNNFYFKDKNSAAINIFLSNGQIATGPSNLNMTNNRVVVENYQISCENSSVISRPLVKIKFDIRYNTTSTRSEDTASLSYQSGYKLRN